MNRLLSAFVATILIAALTVPALAGPLSVPAEPDQAKKMQAAVEAAREAGDHAATLKEFQRWIELYPNEPLVQAALYQAMSATAEKAGDEAQAKAYAETALKLDPTIGARLAATGSEQVTRGATKLDKVQTGLMVAMAIMQAIQTQRQANQAAAPAAPAAVNYPTAAYGTASYTPPDAGYQPMPGYAPPNPQASSAAAYAPPSEPYKAPGYGPLVTTTRGDMKPVQVIHDHSQMGDAAYFAKSCGALLSVAESKLMFTPGGGEAPRVIPAADIREVRLNRVVGKDVGAFHITTKEGLYLNLAPASGTAEDGRTTVEALRKELGLGE